MRTTGFVYQGTLGSLCDEGFCVILRGSSILLNQLLLKVHFDILNVHLLAFHILMKNQPQLEGKQIRTPSLASDIQFEVISYCCLTP